MLELRQHQRLQLTTSGAKRPMSFILRAEPACGRLPLAKDMSGAFQWVSSRGAVV